MVLWPFMADYNPDHRIKSSVFSSSCTFHPYGVNFFIFGAPGIPGRPGSAADLTISGRSPAAGPAAPAAFPAQEGGCATLALRALFKPEEDVLFRTAASPLLQ